MTLIRTFCSGIIRVQYIWRKIGRSRSLGTPDTLIYVTYLLMTGLKVKKFQFHTVAQNTCSQIVFTKSLHGSLFAKFCDVIIRWKHVDILQVGPPPTKECV